MGNSKIKVTLRSLLCSYLMTGILLFVLAFALYKLRLKESQITIGVNLIYVITCLAGGILMGKGIRQRRFFWGMLLGFLYFLVLMLVSFSMHKGISAGLNQLLLTMGICVASGTIGGMLS